MRFGHASDLLRLEDAADTTEVHLQNRCSTRAQHACELVLRRQALTRRDRNRRGLRNARHLLRHVRRSRLFEPERLVLLEPLRHPNRATRRELPVRAKQHVHAWTDGLADLLDEPLAALQGIARRIARVERAVDTSGIELDGREAALNVLDRALCRQIGVVIDVDRVARLGIEVRIGAQSLAHLATEHVVDGLAGRLADDVPERHLDAAEAPHHRGVGAELEARAVDLAVHRLDAMRIHADNAALHHVVDALDDHVWPEGGDVTLAIANDAVVRDQLDEDEVVAALARWRVANDKRFPGCNLHQNTTTLRSASPRLTESTASLISSSGYVPVTSSSSLSRPAR